jgi:cell division protein FtsI (penicillin-binding protein 3)
MIELRTRKTGHYHLHCNASYRGRYYVVIAILLLASLGLVARLVDLTVINRTFLQDQGNARTLRTITLPAYRGMIVDRNNAPLAISTPVDSVWINPKDFDPSHTQLIKLANLLEISKAEINDKADNAGDKEFVYLKRGLDPNVGKAVKALNIAGIYLQNEYKRFYPEGEVTAHVLGFTNIDDQGQEGLELAYNQWLGGVDGLMKVLRDRFGHIVQTIDVLRKPRPGQNLQLSIDRRIQYFAFQDLAAGVAHFKAKSGSVVVLDVNTGEILAMVNWPSYNPNNRSSNTEGRYRNRAVTDLFEPGSTMKTFSMAAALATGKYQPASTVDTSPGIIYINGHKVDDDGHNNGVMDMAGILKVSSNVGMSKITLSLPPENWWSMVHKMGFGQLTESGFPGERSGLLMNYSIWDPFVLATNSFGYGISVTALQLARAYAILAADGIKRPVSFLKVAEPPAGEQVLDPKVASELRIMLESVLSKNGGTAPLARVPGYRVTGKTGTAHIVGEHGYERNDYNSIFVGIAPASHPRLVVAVVIHDPQNGQYFGGYVAGPIFSKIMGETLRLLNIPPDDLSDAKPAAIINTKPPAGMVD